MTEVIENGKKHNLLLVDDNHALVYLLAKDLTQIFNVTYFSSANDAADYIQTNPSNLDIVICDFKMPGYDGVDLLSKVLKVNPNTVRIILTGYSSDIDPEWEGRIYHKMIDKNIFKEYNRLITIIQEIKAKS